MLGAQKENTRKDAVTHAVLAMPYSKYSLTNRPVNLHDRAQQLCRSSLGLSRKGRLQRRLNAVLAYTPSKIFGFCLVNCECI